MNIWWSKNWPISLQENMKNTFKKLEEEFTEDTTQTTVQKLGDILQEVTFIMEDVSKYRIITNN
jgi:hypothetical protein